MKLSIVTLNYKTPDKTIACIESVYDQYKAECIKGDYEHIIVDNDSNDGSLDIIKSAVKSQKYKHIVIISNKKNEGFAKGCNKGVEKAKGEFVVFLNSDAIVKNRGFVFMVGFLEDQKNSAIVGGKLRNADGSPQLSAAKFYNLPILIFTLLGFERFGFFKQSPATISKVDWVSGACMMVNKKTFNEIGQFDSHLFMYMEDMELCFRAKKSGYSTYYFPDIDIVHSSHGSSNRSFAIINIYKGILYFYKIHKPRWQYVVARSILRLKAVILVIIGKIAGNSYLFETYEKTLADS